MPQSLTCTPYLHSVPFMFRVILLLFTLCAFWPISAQAVLVTGLYEAEVPVSDQSAEGHKTGISAALLEVLIKLTGDRNMQGSQAASYLLGQPDQYVQQYEYRNKSVVKDNQLSLKQQLFLWVRFNANALDKELRAYNVPVWGTVRPSTLVWLAAQDTGTQKIIGLEDDSGYTGILDNRAQDRGIALVYPLLDPEDAAKIRATDIWGGFKEPVLNASERYHADAILTGSIEALSENLWQVRWTVFIDQQVNSWTTQGETPESVLTQGTDMLADTLAARFAQVGAYAQESGIEVVVNDIGNFDQYSKVLHYLTSLNSVINVDVKTVEPTSVTFLVTAAGGELAITRAIELGQMLKSINGTGSPYRLTP